MSHLDNIKKYCNKLLLSNYQRETPLPKAIIMDVDDTLVNTNIPYKLLNIKGNIIFVFPGIQQIIDIAKLAKKLGYNIIILTARPKQSFLSTKFNLDLLEIPADVIIMNNYNHPPSFKYDVRKSLTLKYSILFTIGDQPTDVDGPDEIISIKLPNHY